MGTNYYVIENLCECCGRHEKLHIGKSSFGWCFSLSYNEDRGLTGLNEWKEFLAGKIVENEYEEVITVEELLRIITERHSLRPNPICDADVQENSLGMGYRDLKDFYRKNHAQPGPNNLLRHIIDGTGICVAHGEGTWDMLKGEFS